MFYGLPTYDAETLEPTNPDFCPWAELKAIPRDFYLTPKN
jgi:hypothetical protein